MKVTEIKGDLIKLSRTGEFDVIVHGCNCFCTQKAGLAPQMVKAFSTDSLPMEDDNYNGDINKLGTIDWGVIPREQEFKDLIESYNIDIIHKTFYEILKKHDVDGIINGLIVVNAYTQYGFGKKKSPVDYDAVTMVMRKINHEFKGMHIGLPWIGSGLAGGDWNKIKGIILRELVDCDVTLVEYKK